jgi:flagellar motor switch protein FliM
MNDVLSNEEIAALVAAAKDGNTPSHAAQVRARQKRIREIDFRRPNKFTPDQRRRIESAHEAFCRTIGTRFSAELRTPVEFEVLAVTQVTWANGLEDIPHGSIYGLVEVVPEGTRMLMSIESMLVFRLIDRMLGGSGADKVRQRELTEIEGALARRLFSGICEPLSNVWHELVEVDLHVLELASDRATVQLAPPSEPSLSVTIEVRVDGASATLSLLVPHRSIESVLEHLPTGHYGDDALRVHDDSVGDAVKSVLESVEVELRAEVGAVSLTIDEVLALQPGDLLPLGVPAQQGVLLCAGETPLHRARPGRNRSQRAVQVVERLGEVGA